MLGTSGEIVDKFRRAHRKDVLLFTSAQANFSLNSSDISLSIQYGYRRKQNNLFLSYFVIFITTIPFLTISFPITSHQKKLNKSLPQI
jgi:hypothetical protein